MIIFGYICGIIHKCIYKPDMVILLYVLNLVLVSADLVLWFRYRNREVMAELKD